MKPEFSLVVAIYNVSDYIEDFLSSLDAQTYGVEDLDIVFVDDGSTDASGAIAERWADEHGGNVRLLRQENSGQGNARNHGLRYASGEWVTFCDPDDVLADTY